MTERLTRLDASFLYLEEPTTPMHVGSVQVFTTPKGGFNLSDLLSLIEQRISLVPRYRQKVQRIPFNLSTPVWVDDPGFDASYHVRSAALPRPGSDTQLRELVGRLMSRRLDPDRALWEMTLVEGLSGNRFALVTKTHYALVDGVAAIDLGQVILDPSPKPRRVTPEVWTPQPLPGPVELVAGAVGDLVRTPSRLPETVQMGLSDARHLLGRIGGTATGMFSAARTATRPAPASPLNAVIGEQRRFAMTRTELDSYRLVRKEYGVTVNDVVLATVAGALRQWLLTRGRPVTTSSVVRAMVPVSVRDGTGHPDAPAQAESGAASWEPRTASGGDVTAYLVDLPVGEPNPVVRLHHVAFAMRGHQETGQSVGADALARLTGFAPPTLHALGARAASQLSRRLFNLVVINVPGPQIPLYAGGARMEEVFPVVPLARGQAVSIGLTSYNGRVYYGLNADRDAMPDVDVLADLMTEALEELVETVR
jgi:WS/DGAT/MGAT family acyltransferase